MQDGKGYDFESIHEDDGTRIQLKEEEEFVGQYRGFKTVTNDGTQFKVYLFKDSTGRNWNILSNYVLDEAMEKCEEGDIVKLVFHGKAELDNGRSLNKYSVFRAKGEFPITPPAEITDEQGVKF
jgi:hypothetical protein